VLDQLPALPLAELVPLAISIKWLGLMESSTRQHEALAVAASSAPSADDRSW
jgi:hypothetical protein